MDAEQTQVNFLVARAFEEIGLPYFPGGSMASSLHGIYRAPADADFVAAIRPWHVNPLASLLQPDFYADVDAMRAAVESRRSFNLIHLETIFKVDVFVLRTDPYHLIQMRRRILQATGPDGTSKIYFASPEDTVLSKLEWYRKGGHVSDRQWQDVLGVIKVQSSRLDCAYLREWARELGCNDLLHKAFDDAGLPWTD